jgi:hypothetical protein
LFYCFALLCFLAGPLAAGFVAVKNSETGRTATFLISGGIVLGTSLFLFVLTYAFAIILLITTVPVPASCDSTYHGTGMPAALGYTLPGGADGIVVSEDADTLIVARPDYEWPPHPITVFLVNRSDGKILWSAGFPSDNIAAAIDDDTAYVFYEGLGEFIDRHTGLRQDRVLSMDNYGMNTNGKFQTTGIISFWKRDGTVKSLSRLTFSGVVRGCHIRGDTGEITRL